MQDGYVFLWRKSLSSKVFNSAELWQLWTWCLMRANHKQVFVPIRTGKGKTIIEVQPGQFIFGRKSCAKELNSNESSIRNRIKKLESFGNIVVKPDTHYSIVSICNWGDYQDSKKEKGQPKDNQRTTKGQPKDTDKNEKNEKTKEIVEFLNVTTGRSYKATTAATQKAVSARLLDGYTVEDFKSVIASKSNEWLGSDMEKFLTPDTLFRPSNFEKYLQNATGSKEEHNFV